MRILAAGRGEKNTGCSFLFHILIGMALSILSMAISDFFFVVYSVYFLAALVPHLAVLIRRLHDIGKSGWWILIFLVLFIGPIWLLILCVLDSQPGENQWGPNPKESYQGTLD